MTPFNFSVSVYIYIYITHKKIIKKKKKEEKSVDRWKIFANILSPWTRKFNYNIFCKRDLLVHASHEVSTTRFCKECVQVESVCFTLIFFFCYTKYI